MLMGRLQLSIVGEELGVTEDDDRILHLQVRPRPSRRVRRRRLGDRGDQRWLA